MMKASLRLRLRQTWSEILELFKADLQLLRLYPRLQWAVMSISLVPAVYALIYLSSLWDPAANTADLSAAILNKDVGVIYQGQALNVGNELTRKLMKERDFGFIPYDDEDEARRAVRRGELTFALVIPRDFSANAVPGTQPGVGRLVVYTSEGNNYTSAGFAKRFAADLSQQVNETLNEQRWTLVLSSAMGSRQNLSQLNEALQRLQQGSKQLETGTKQYSMAAQELGKGVQNLSDGVHSLDARGMSDSDLSKMKNGLHSLSQGQKELSRGLDQLHTRASQLAKAAEPLGEPSGPLSSLGMEALKSGQDFSLATRELSIALGRAHEASVELSSGSHNLESGIVKMGEGLQAYDEAIHQISQRLPEEARLNAFTQKGLELSQGSSHLRTGIDLIQQSLPKGQSEIEGSPQGLANSVAPHLEIDAPVPNNGSAFAPNMVSVALWIGAVIVSYLFKIDTVQTSHQSFGHWSKCLGKLAMPALLVLEQVLLVMLALLFVLKVHPSNILTLTLTLALASLVFLCMVFALQRLFGEAGKLLSGLLLTLQLAAGGGILPVELSGGFFRFVHDWLPFSWVIRAFRTSMFGAYDHAWASAWLVVVGSGVLALLLATYAGRWKEVNDGAYKPSMDV